jgi:hypothetical protein
MFYAVRKLTTPRYAFATRSVRKKRGIGRVKTMYPERKRPGTEEYMIRALQARVLDRDQSTEPRTGSRRPGDAGLQMWETTVTTLRERDQ